MKETRANILSMALQEFNLQGFVNVRLQEIADAAKISVGNMAYHFKNKDAIIEVLHDQLKKEQETLLYDFRAAHLFEDLNRQLQGVFRIQKQYIFFYLDTLEVLRAYPVMKEKHQLHITWQLQQIEWMLEFNSFRGSFQEPVNDAQYQHLAFNFG
ncbi:MAG: TetR/AcrR family transcriptional regulator [Chitinophagales bacterium]